MTISPTLSGAIAKAQRGIALLGIPQAASEHLRAAVDAFKSAAALAKAHHTVLVELEGELPAPGPALFDEAGTPTPAAALAPVTTDLPGLRLEEHPVLSMDPQEYIDASWNGREPLEEELLFALRLHTRARGLDYKVIRDMIMEDLNGLDENSFPWVTEQILESGDFQWPHKCEDCTCLETPDKNGLVLCWSCKNKRARAAEAAGKKEAKKAAKKATPKPQQNPLDESA